MSFTTRFGAVAFAAALVVGISSTPAFAHEGGPKPGTVCKMSGMSTTHHGETFVCVSKGTAKPRWGKALPVSKSALTLSDGWAKAADTGMTAAFGMLKNPTDKPINVIGAYSAYAPVLQLHEVVMKDGAMVMQQKPGGFVIPAGGMLELKPGGNHIMFLNISKPIKPGAMVPVTLVGADGSLLRVKLMAKVYTGANETYDAGSSTMGSM